MSTRRRIDSDLARRLLRIGLAAMALFLIVLAARWLMGKPEELQTTLAREIIRPAQPIEAEANVFRTRPGDLALDAGLARRRPAHPRTLATYRTLRAFPGAPPRMPHGLTAEEFRSASCRTCHERGGYSARFDAYTPVTPHPELEDCLQCHAANDEVVGTALPGSEPDSRCRQCHAPGASQPAALRDWRTAAWPKVGAGTPGVPPAIPHELQMRGNCLACHMGVGAVAEIRVDHPERANCRQCHVEGGS